MSKRRMPLYYTSTAESKTWHAKLFIGTRIAVSRVYLVLVLVFGLGLDLCLCFVRCEQLWCGLQTWRDGANIGFFWEKTFDIRSAACNFFVFYQIINVYLSSCKKNCLITKKVAAFTFFPRLRTKYAFFHIKKIPRYL